MNNDLKNLYKIGLTNSIQSFAPVLLWVLAGILFSDSRYSNGYIITYPYQFLSSLLYCILFKAQLKHEIKCKVDNHGSACMGVKILFITYLAVFGLSAACSGSILKILNLDNSNKSIFLFGLSQMFMGWTLCGIVTMKQYDGENKKAFAIVLFWYTSNIICLVLPGICGIGAESAFTMASIWMFLLLLAFMHRYCRQSGGTFSLKSGITYSLYDIPDDIGMLIVYVFSINRMAESSAAVLGAYNMMSMCADTQWDILRSAIDTVGTLKVKAGTFVRSRKKLFLHAAVYSATLFVSIAIFIFSCYMIPSYRKSISFDMVWIMFLLECWAFPLYAIQYMMTSWVAIEHPNGYSFIITMVTYIARFVTVALIASDYRASLGVVTSAIVGNLCHIAIYQKYMKKTKGDL